MLSYMEHHNLCCAVVHYLEFYKQVGNAEIVKELEDLLPKIRNLLPKIRNLQENEKSRDSREKALANAIRMLMSAEGGEPGDTDDQKEAWEEAEAALEMHDAYQHCRQSAEKY